MKRSIRVLSVGLEQCLDMAYGSALLGRPCEITQRGELETYKQAKTMMWWF
jgi:hypothetical protein